MFKKSKLSVARKMSLIVTLMVFISAITVGIFGFVLYRRDAIQLGGERALSIAQTVAAGISGDNLQQVMQSGETNAEYDKEKAMADDTALQTGTAYLYVLSADIRADTAFYYMEGYVPTSGEEELQLLDEEDASIYAEEMFTTINTGQPTYTDAYTSGEFGNMVSGFAAVYNSTGQVVAVVGADIGIDEVLAKVNNFGLMTVLIIVVCGLAFGAASIYIVNRLVGKPIQQLTAASGKIAVGDLDIDVNIQSQDEIGQLSQSFVDMAHSTQRQVDLLQQIAAGDLTVVAKPRSEKDQMTHAMNKTVDQLSSMFAEIKLSTHQLTSASSQIADGSQHLAEGATEQASTVSQLQENISEVANKAVANVEIASKASSLVELIKQNAETGTRQMRDMLQAVQQIDEASNAISSVVKTIDEIASQTNILALNAAVEAARAGQHGKGFAVVAEEVRNLAAKSAESAKQTDHLIHNSLKKAALGVSIAQETSASFEKIVSGIDESGQLIANIAQASEAQNDAIGAINNSIDRVSMVVQQNSATSEESAASSEELNGQSQQLAGMLMRFKLRDDVDLNAPSAPLQLPY